MNLHYGKRTEVKYKCKLYLSNGSDGICQNCRKQFPLNQLELDHIIPQYKGGSNNIKNLQLLCHQCHLQKHDIDSKFSIINIIGYWKHVERNQTINILYRLHHKT